MREIQSHPDERDTTRTDHTDEDDIVTTDIHAENAPDTAYLAPAESVLDTAEQAFRLLTAEPEPLALDGSTVAGALPKRPIPLTELRDLLLADATTQTEREAAWRQLVHAAQTLGQEWTIGAVGVAMPGLRSIAGQLSAGYTGDRDDLDAEILTGFLERLKTIDPDAGSLAARLVWAAGRAGAKLRAEAWDTAGRTTPLPESIEPPALARHPDLLLAEAMYDGVLSWLEAAVIGATRLEDARIADIAVQTSMTYPQVWELRKRAERRLVRYLAGNLRTKISTGDSEISA